MEKFLASYPAAGWAVIVVLLSLVWWLVKMAIKESLERVLCVEKKTQELEKNYKEEFKQVREDSNEKHLIIMDTLTEVKVQIAEIKGSINN